MIKKRGQDIFPDLQSRKVAGLRLIWVMVVGLVVVGVGCDRGAEHRAERTGARPAGQETAEIAKVKVTQTGVIYLNGKKASMEEVRQAFARLKQVNGVVWYYRENQREEPSPQAMAVIEAIVATKLPVRLVEKDFE